MPNYRAPLKNEKLVETFLTQQIKRRVLKQVQLLDFYWLISLFVLITIAQTDELNLTSIQRNITLTSMFSSWT